jgi:DNA-directed RNA polymerase specialized sigma24 family protein
MAKKLDPMDLKQIIRLHLEGFSNREISKTLGIGRNAINNYIQMFKSCDKALEDILVDKPLHFVPPKPVKSVPLIKPYQSP